MRVDTNDYSANPRFVGRRVAVRVDLDSVVAEAPPAAQQRLGNTPLKSLANPGEGRRHRGVELLIGVGVFAVTRAAGLLAGSATRRRGAVSA